MKQTVSPNHSFSSLFIILLLTSFLLEISFAQNKIINFGLRFNISFPTEKSAAPLDGRVLLMLSADSTQEPRFQITDDEETQLLFGVNVDGLKPGMAASIDRSVLGYPLKSLAEVPAGWYWVQALLHKYETFHLKTGYTVKLPMDRGEGQQWNRAPGNLYSAPKKMWIDPRKSATIKITLDQEIPPIEPAKDTKYIKHVKIQSKLLTEFWGRPMYLGACVLLPHGFDEHPEARYPLAIFHGHFPATFGGFRETPPDPNLKPDYSKRFNIHGYNKIVQEHAYQLYKDWTGPKFPRMIIIEIQHANPYYDDSYAVNSANLGPYGDAITYELIPYVDRKYRTLATRHGRVVAGLSMGGYGAIKLAIRYPARFILAGSFSGALYVPLGSRPDNKDISESLRETFGQQRSAQWIKNDPLMLLDSIRTVSALPYFYVATGKDYALGRIVENNRKLVEKFRERGVLYEYHESSGGHNWQYWDKELRHFLRRVSSFDPLSP